MKQVTIWECTSGDRESTVDAGSIRKVEIQGRIEYEVSAGKAGPERHNGTRDDDFEIGRPSRVRLHWIVHKHGVFPTIEDALAFIADESSPVVATNLRERIANGSEQIIGLA